MGRYLFVCFVLFVVLAFIPKDVVAAEANYVTFISIVRGREFWRAGKDLFYLTEQKKIINGNKVRNTWLVQFDALLDSQLVDEIKDDLPGNEKGLFLEVSRKLALKAYVNYDWNSEKWERADKVFLSGYGLLDRKKLIDTAFEEFKSKFGSYPLTVGAWHIDGWSLEYMKDKYGIEAVLGLADQYSTDGYQEWGQYIGEPYYPSKEDVLEPAFNKDDKIGVVKLQWAAREPLLSYGLVGHSSNYSVQVNDYFRYHKLGVGYFSKLLNVYTKDIQGSLGQVTLGLEVAELERGYLSGLVDQLKTVVAAGVKSLTASEFARAYKGAYPEVSPSMFVRSTDDKGKELTWFQSPWYRAGVLNDHGKRRLIDLRFYHSSAFRDNDQLLPDKRQNLYRVIPAVIDDLVLGNGIDLTDEMSFQPQKIESKSAIPSNLFLGFNVKVQDAGGVISLRPYPVQEHREGWEWSLYGQIKIWDRLKQILGGLVPDFRMSKIEGSWVLGVRTGSQTLWGVRLHKFKIGNLNYEYPVLDSFLNLDKVRHPDISLWGRQEDQLSRFGRQGKVYSKGVNYGADEITQELTRKKLFENSFYVVTAE